MLLFLSVSFPISRLWNTFGIFLGQKDTRFLQLTCWTIHLHSIARTWIINAQIWSEYWQNSSNTNTSTVSLFTPLVWENGVLLKARQCFNPSQVFQASLCLITFPNTGKRVENTTHSRLVVENILCLELWFNTRVFDMHSWSKLKLRKKQN